MQAGASLDALSAGTYSLGKASAEVAAPTPTCDSEIFRQISAFVRAQSVVSTEASRDSHADSAASARGHRHGHVAAGSLLETWTGAGHCENASGLAASLLYCREQQTKIDQWKVVAMSELAIVCERARPHRGQLKPLKI